MSEMPKCQRIEADTRPCGKPAINWKYNSHVSDYRCEEHLVEAKRCGCEEHAQLEAVTDHGWIPNVTPGAKSWHKMVKHTAVGCKVLTPIEAERLEEPGEGVKYDKDKARWDLLPFKAVDQVVGVLTYGAKKYAPENWRSVDGWRWRYFGAALRHMVAWFGGQKIDPESGYHHLAHAACCVLFMLELDNEVKEIK